MSWSIHRRNKTSGKSRGGIIATNMGEYTAKTTCNDGNAGSHCFHYTPVDSDGNRWKLFPNASGSGEWFKVDWLGRKI